jgi:hypothetical protein
MKLFHFYRNDDHSGVSGTGPVVEGVEFTNGWCALRWISNKSSMCFYQSIEEVKAIHSHGGKTEVIVHDFEPLKRKDTEVSNSRMELLMKIIEETSRVITLGEGDELSRNELNDSVNGIHSLIEQLRSNIQNESDLARDENQQVRDSVKKSESAA